MNKYKELNRCLKTSTFILTIIERDDGEKKQTLENRTKKSNLCS